MDDYEDLLPDHDADAALGIPTEFTQRTTLGQAVVMASNIHRELVEQVDGMLVDYVRFAAFEASAAAALLLTMHPKDERELFELQKKAAPYASVMDWIRKTLIKGANSKQQLDDMDTQEQERRDE